MQHSRLMARNITASLLMQLLSWGMTLIVTYYVSSYLGERGFGAISLAGAYAAIFSLGMSLGTSTALLREIARDRSRLPELLSAAIAIRIPLGIVSAAVGIIVARLLHYSAELQLLCAVSLVWVIFAQLNDALASSLLGLEEIPQQNAAALVEKFVSCSAILYLVLRHAPLPWIVGSAFLSTAVSSALYVVALRPHFTRFVWPSWATAKSLTTAGAPFLTTAVFVAIYGQSDPILLERLSGLSVVAWYSLAKRLGGSTMTVPVALASAILPTLSRMFKEDYALFENLVRRLVGCMFLLVVPFASVLIFAPKPLLQLMHEPAGYDHAIPVLIILGFAIILWYLSQATGTALIACDRQNVLSKAAGVAALISVPICAALIWVTQRSLTNGAIGAIISDVAVETLLVAMYMRGLPARCISQGQVTALLKGVIAAIPVVVPLYFIHAGRWSIFVTLPGLIAYLPICYALGAIAKDDIDMFRSALKKKGDSELVITEDIGRDAGFAESSSMMAEEKIAAVAEGR